MKRLMKRVLPMILVMAMLAPMSSGVFATEQEQFIYVSLGASESNGYGLRGCVDEYWYTPEGLAKVEELEKNGGSRFDNEMIKVTGYQSEVKGSYPFLIAQKLKETLGEDYEVVFHQLAQSSMRTFELRVLLEDDYYGDSYTKWRFYDKDDPENKNHLWFGNQYSDLTPEGSFKKLQSEYRQYIADADLITYAMGTNDFGVFLFLQLLRQYFKMDFNDISDSGTVEMFQKTRSKLEAKIIELTDGKLNTETFSQMDFYLDTFAYAITGYCFNLCRTIEDIRALNDHADIVVTSVQSMLADYDIEYNGFIIPMGDILTFAIDMVNAYVALAAPVRDEYTYADLTANGHVTMFADEIVEYDGNPENLRQNFKDCFDLYDGIFHVRHWVENYIEEAGKSDKLEDALNAAYDAMARFMKESLLICTLDASGFADLDTAEVEVRNGISWLYKGAVDAVLTGGVFDVDGEIEKLLSNPGRAIIASIDGRTGRGNTFYCHPNLEGHQEMFEAIWSAYTEHTTGAVAFAVRLAGMEEKIIGFTSEYGVKYFYSLADLLMKGLNLDKKTVQAIKDLAPSNDTMENMVKKLILLSGITDKAGLDVLGGYIEESEQECAHIHTLKYVSGKAAGLIIPGWRTHFICTTCGKRYTNILCTNEVTLNDLVVSRNNSVSKSFGEASLLFKR